MVLKVDFNMEAKEMQDKMNFILILQIKFSSFLLLICESNKKKISQRMNIICSVNIILLIGICFQG